MYVLWHLCCSISPAWWSCYVRPGILDDVHMFHTCMMYVYAMLRLSYVAHSSISHVQYTHARSMERVHKSNYTVCVSVCTKYMLTINDIRHHNLRASGKRQEETGGGGCGTTQRKLHIVCTHAVLCAQLARDIRFRRVCTHLQLYTSYAQQHQRERCFADIINDPRRVVQQTMFVGPIITHTNGRRVCVCYNTPRL